MLSDVLEFYPDTQLALQLWNVYVKSVDPVLKVLHIPTVQSTVVATILEPRSAQSSTVALTFAIYFAAVTALCHDTSNEPIDLPCEKRELLKRYRASLDRLLMVTELMSRPEMTALQALAIYVVSTDAGPGIHHAPLLGLVYLTDYVCFRLVYGSMKLAGVYGSSMAWRSASPNRLACTEMVPAFN